MKTEGHHPRLSSFVIRGSVAFVLAVELCTFAVLCQYFLLSVDGPRYGPTVAITSLLLATFPAFVLMWRRAPEHPARRAALLLSGFFAWATSFLLTGFVFWSYTHGAPVFGSQGRAKGLLNVVAEPFLVAVLASLAVFAFPASTATESTKADRWSYLLLGIIVLLSVTVELVFPALGGS